MRIVGERNLLPGNKQYFRTGRGDDVTLADLRALPSFSTSADSVTEWKVEIPAELIDEVREKLKANLNQKKIPADSTDENS